APLVHSFPCPMASHSVLARSGNPGDLHSFPTRRSSDLEIARAEIVPREAIQRLRGVGEAQGGGFERLGHRANGLVAALEDPPVRSEEHTSELQSREKLVCRLLLEKKKVTQEAVRQSKRR